MRLNLEKDSDSRTVGRDLVTQQGCIAKDLPDKRKG